MTCPRKDIVDPCEVAAYHCIARCVRRAFLCGADPVSRRSYEHRRKWIRERLDLLARAFAIEVIAYAAMHNHLHTVLQTRPDEAAKWTPQEVARRWLSIFPRRRISKQVVVPTDEDISAITVDPEKVELYRQRLCSLSWFHRCLNENIARRANAEDDCTGRFWEGRFKCQRLYGAAAIVACAVYVDLNPVRAGIAPTPELSDHTSIQDRICEFAGHYPERCREWPKVPLVPVCTFSNGSLTVPDYIKLVDSTGRLIRLGKQNIAEDIAPILERLKINGKLWVDTTEHLHQRFRRVVGPPKSLEAAARKARKSWFHGMLSARLIFGGAEPPHAPS